MFVIVNQKTNLDFMKQSEMFKSQETQFKAIFDNLEEPVVIMSEQNAQYANDSFIKQFEKEIE